ncbi:hypothetical protein FHL15_008016 [Xylaria flabelliformis]|uniref:Uncharacterized protein n=1 Tax=Xylaria flabelliformis TaxID=2512241 RepID=A0A553HSX4_9PEZI|nr:hypothetical protein FHL15_008016 [Xylaria flabelliformis]
MQQLPNYIIHTGENCAECKAARHAEETCQRIIYKSKPLNLDLKNKKRMSALLAAYRRDMSTRRIGYRFQRSRKAVAQHGIDLCHEKTEEDYVAPRFIMALHRDVSYVKDGPIRNLI